MIPSIKKIIAPFVSAFCSDVGCKAMGRFEAIDVLEQAELIGE